MIGRFLIAAALVVGLSSGGPARAESGKASVYAYEGGKTASGERANPRALTAAHPDVEFEAAGALARLWLRLTGRGPKLS